MKKIRATWVSRRERSIWCLDFTGLYADPLRLAAEIEASDAVIRRQGEDSLLVAMVIYRFKPVPALVEFMRQIAVRPRNPIHKMAVMGLTGFDRFWYTRVRRIPFPRGTAFFDDYERAKDWLVSEW